MAVIQIHNFLITDIIVLLLILLFVQGKYAKTV